MKIVIRMDDITPDMDWDRFLQFKEILDELNIKPVIGVVPENQDINLSKNPVRKDFWEYVKTLQELGWTIAMHGLHHVYTTSRGGLFPLNHFSEFAGIDYDTQYSMLKSGIQILKKQNIHTDIFMAPAHSYDINTLLALKELGFHYITDGFGKRTYVRENLIFCPIASNRRNCFKNTEGITTLVFHLNSLTKQQVEEQGNLLRREKNKLVDFSDFYKTIPKKRGWWGNMVEYMAASGKHFLVKCLVTLKRAKDE